MPSILRNIFKIILMIYCLVLQSGHCEIAHKSNRFLSHLFHKYGSHGTISFEGLEHLMHNLGLGGLEFSPKHTLDEHRTNDYKVATFSIDDIIDEQRITSKSDKYDNTAINNDKIEFNSSTVDQELATTEEATTIYSADKDYNIIKLMNVFDNDKQEDIFRTMHDPYHRHPRHRDDKLSTKNLAKTCLSPLSLIQLYVSEPINQTLRNRIYQSSMKSIHHRNSRTSTTDDTLTEHDHDDSAVSNIQITPTTFMSMCPALLVQIEQRSCIDRDSVEKRDTVITNYAWISAVVSVLIISLCGLVGIAMVPLTKFSAYQEILRFLVAIAIGTLCGDALMHLLPHALVPHSDTHSSNENQHHNHENEHKVVLLCGCAFLCALIMYSIEALLPLISGHTHNHNHNHSHTHPSSKDVNSIDVCQKQVSCEDIENDVEISKKSNEENVMVIDSTSIARPMLTPVAFMVVIGDGLHNLTDGMAIGAAFGVDPVTGMATALAVLCHELPHELGDFALLLQTGVSIRRAILLNIISSVLSFVGMIIGLLVVNLNNEFVRWIYAGTAGTFLYIALADLVPELGRTKTTFQSVMIQVVGILLGGIIMLIIALYEDSLKKLF